MFFSNSILYFSKRKQQGFSSFGSYIARPSSSINTRVSFSHTKLLTRFAHELSLTNLLCSLPPSMRLAAPQIIFHPIRGRLSFWPSGLSGSEIWRLGKTITMWKPQSLNHVRLQPTPFFFLPSRVHKSLPSCPARWPLQAWPTVLTFCRQLSAEQPLCPFWSSVEWSVI